ncbi:MAG TPA: POTRA domain-containing protein [Candidatus Angelobacter sp.]|nr:POTRA domain-containing protein [Candidatus Angelobacter sp.]
MKSFRRHHAKSVFVAVLVFAFAFLIPAFAQEATPPPGASISYEGQKVASVEIAGRPNLNLRTTNALIAQPMNAPYKQAQVDATVAALKKSGAAEDVQVNVTPEANGLRVLFVLEPAYYFGVFQFSKEASRFPYTRLLQAADYPRQEPYTTGRVEEAESNLLDFFHQIGHFRATVEPALHEDSAHGVVNVEFLIKPGRRAKFGAMKIEGVSPAQARRLTDSVRSLRARIRGAYVKPGKNYSKRALDNGIKYMQGQMAKQHYLAARIGLAAVKYNPRTNRADLSIYVTQGPKIQIKIAGAHIWGRTQKKLIPIYQENTVDPDLVYEGQQDLRSYFQSKGFFDAQVKSQIEHQGPDVTVLYQINKGKRGKVESVAFHGNQHFEDDDLQAKIPIKTARRFFFWSHGTFSDQLIGKSVKALKGVYENAGYSKVSVTPTVTRHGGNVQVAFQIDEGARDIVELLQLQGNKSIPEDQLTPAGLNLEPGKPYSQQLLNKDRDQIMATYLSKGFLRMTFRASTEADKQNPQHIRVFYNIDEGPQVYTASLYPMGQQHTKPEVIARTANIKVGKPLSETALLQSESQLYTLGDVFDWTSVDTRQPITDQTHTDVLVKVHEAKRNSITYGLGFEAEKRGGNVPGGTVAVPGLPPVGLPSNFKTSEQTFWGPRGSIQYTRRDVRGRAETINIGVFAARLDQRVNAGWLNPRFWNSSWTSTVSASIERSSENPLFTSRLGRAGIQFQRYLDAKKTKSVYVRYNFSRTNLNNLLDPDLVLPTDQNVRLSTITGSFIRDTRDNPLDAHVGIYESFEVDLNPSALGSNTNFVRFLGQTAYYKSIFTQSVVWANSVRLGVEQAFAGARIPLSESFFSGGGSTLRGFPLNGAGPQRSVPVCGNPADPTTCAQITVPVGGPQLFIVNSELRFPTSLISKLGGVAFYDGGNVFTSVGFGDIGNYSNTIGVGLRYATPVGPVRFDIGRNLNPVNGVSPWQYFITLGQAF